MFPENEKDLVGAAAEHIEEAAIADGLEKERKPQPEQVDAGLPKDITSEDEIVAAAAEHIEEAAVANGQVER